MKNELIFSPLTVDYQQKIDARLFGSDNVSCDYCLASILLFTEIKELEIAEDDVALYIKGQYHDEDIFFSPLCNDDDFITAINRLKEYSSNHDVVLRFYSTKAHVIALLKNEGKSDEEISDLLENKFFRTDNFCFENDRSSAEYVYTPEKLISLSGSHFKSKRNEIHNFCAKYEGKYELKPYEDSDLDGVMDLVKEWSKAKEFSAADEPTHLKYILENRKKLRADACVLKVNGEIVATSVYSIMACNVGDEIFERCKPEYKSAYPLIAKTVAGYLSSCKYINFEEDLGLEGLRFSKTSYNPDFLIEKFIVCENKEKKLKTLYRNIFGDSEKFTDKIFSELNQCSNTALITDNDKVVSSVYFRNKTLAIDKNSTTYPFIYALGTDDEYRYKGLAKSVTKRLMNMINDQGYGFVGLFPCPVKREFYEKMDFITFNYAKKTSLKDVLLEGTVIKRTTNPNINDYTTLFNNSFNRFNVCQERDNYDTATMIEETLAYDGVFYEFYFDNELYGYCILSKEGIEESIFDFGFIESRKTNTQKSYCVKDYEALLEKEVFVFHPDCLEHAKQNGVPYTMIRPINKYQFVKDFISFIPNDRDFNVNLFIKDDFIGNAIINLLSSEGKCFVHTFADETAPIINLDVKELAEWIFGLKTVDGLPDVDKTKVKVAFSDTY